MKIYTCSDFYINREISKKLYGKSIKIGSDFMQN